MIKGKLIVSLLTKNCSKWIPKVLKNVEQYISLFEDYYCLIVDGYSNDGTQIICKSWVKNEEKEGENKRVFINQPSSNLPRNESLNEARNFVIDTLRPQFGENVYLLLLDADSPNAYPLDPSSVIGFLKAFLKEGIPNWTGLFCNQRNNKYYDILALRDETLTENYQFKYKHLGWHDGSMQKALQKYETTKKHPSGFYPVVSAFGGAGLYNTQHLKEIEEKSKTELKYECWVNFFNEQLNRVERRFECEHVPFHSSIVKNGYSLFINCDWYIGEHL
jgi:glycosyltransferase involved in cell wall biosynthesis